MEEVVFVEILSEIGRMKVKQLDVGTTNAELNFLEGTRESSYKDGNLQAKGHWVFQSKGKTKSFLARRSYVEGYSSNRTPFA